MSILAVGLLVFLGVHSVSIAGPRWRDRVVARIGRWPWQGLYSLVAAVGLGLIVYGYGAARQAPIVLYVPPGWLRGAALAFMVPVFPLLLAAYFPGRIKTAVKHPMLTATKIWALAHLLANGMLADLVLFGSFILWAAMDRVSVNGRGQRAVPALPASRWNDVLVLAAGLAIYAAFIGGGHLRLFGVPVGSPWG